MRTLTMARTIICTGKPLRRRWISPRRDGGHFSERRVDAGSRRCGKNGAEGSAGQRIATRLGVVPGDVALATPRAALRATAWLVRGSFHDRVCNADRGYAGLAQAAESVTCRCRCDSRG